MKARVRLDAVREATAAVRRDSVAIIEACRDAGHPQLAQRFIVRCGAAR
jgi:hypothetical protein